MEGSIGFDIFSDTWEDVEVFNGESPQGLAENLDLFNVRESSVDDNVFHTLCYTMSSSAIKFIEDNFAGQSFSNIFEMNKHFLLLHSLNCKIKK